MCGRFVLKTPVGRLVPRFDIHTVLDAPSGARFNLAPTEPIVVVRADGADSRTLSTVRWGLIPEWSDGRGDLPLMINARVETALERPSFRDPMRRRRCLVPADGFYEWRTEAGRKRPYYVRLRDSEPMAFAGLWDCWQPDGSPAIESCAILTAEANPLLSLLHHRMPLILPREAESAWLDPRLQRAAEVEECLTVRPPDELLLHAVDERVNGVGFDQPDCLEPHGPELREPRDWAEAPPAGPVQLDLL